MHTFFFAMKRAYHSTLRFSRSVLTPLGITPARLDILMLMHGEGGAVEQAWLNRALGLTRSVVSRMLTRMAELGMLVRRRHPMDRRRNFVRLTKEGKELLEAFFADCMRWRIVDLALASILAPRSWSHEGSVDAALRRVEGPLWNLRRGFRDDAPRCFGDDPWGRWRSPWRPLPKRERER